MMYHCMNLALMPTVRTYARSDAHGDIMQHDGTAPAEAAAAAAPAAALALAALASALLTCTCTTPIIAQAQHCQACSYSHNFPSLPGLNLCIDCAREAGNEKGQDCAIAGRHATVGPLHVQAEASSVLGASHCRAKQVGCNGLSKLYGKAFTSPEMTAEAAAAAARPADTRMAMGTWSAQQYAICMTCGSCMAAAWRDAAFQS